MNKLIISFLFLISLFSTPLWAQDYTGIKKSEKIEVIDGRKFYIHKVKKGQTAYSLSKAYGVSLDEIYKFNPGADQGLQLDQELKIPVRTGQTIKPQTAVLLKDSLSEDGSFIFHPVQRGETLYGIMKKYNVNQDVLLQYNPGLTANLHPGDLIKIPTQDYLVSQKAKDLYDNLTEYKVKKKDTYYRLQKKYGIGQQQLEQLNPQLKNGGLQKGMIILMPTGLKKLDTIPSYVEIVPDTIIPPADSLLQDSAFVQLFDCDTLVARQDTFRIALMLPFWEEDEADINTSNAYYTKESKLYRSFTFIQFYEGFLMALDSLKKQGFNAEVYVYDTKNDTATVRAITQKPEFASFDLIIGPLFTKNLQIVIEAAKEHHAIVVNPFSRDESLLSGNANVYKLMPSQKSRVEAGVQWLADSLPDSRILIIYSGRPSEQKLLSGLKKDLWQFAGNGVDTTKVFVFKYGDDGINKVVQHLAKEGNNVLINLSIDEAKVSNLLRTLNPRTDKHKIYILGSDLQWKRYKTLEIKYLVNMHLTLCGSYFINSDDTLVQQFEQRFINHYQTIPNIYGFTGFDVGWYFMNALYYYGTGFQTCLNKLHLQTMHTRFYFKKTENGGWENSYLNIYQYDNYKLLPKR